MKRSKITFVSFCFEVEQKFQSKMKRKGAKKNWFTCYVKISKKEAKRFPFYFVSLWSKKKFEMKPAHLVLYHRKTTTIINGLIIPGVCPNKLSGASQLFYMNVIWNPNVYQYMCLLWYLYYSCLWYISVDL